MATKLFANIVNGYLSPFNNIHKQLRCHKKKLVNFVRLYILLAFAEFYFPKIGNKVFTGFVKQLNDLDSLDAHSWGITVYNFVVSSLCESSVVLKEGKNKAQRHLNGCAAILQVNILYNFIVSSCVLKL